MVGALRTLMVGRDHMAEDTNRLLLMDCAQINQGMSRSCPKPLLVSMPQHTRGLRPIQGSRTLLVEVFRMC